MSDGLEVSWGVRGREVVRSVAELDAILDRLDAAARREGFPQAVSLTGPGAAGTLSIVVGHERSVLSHVPEDDDPPYLASRGDDDEERPFTYYVAGDHHSEAPWFQTVPAPAAREAARVFLLTGRLDRRVRWEEV